MSGDQLEHDDYQLGHEHGAERADEQPPGPCERLVAAWAPNEQRSDPDHADPVDECGQGR